MSEFQAIPENLKSLQDAFVDPSLPKWALVQCDFPETRNAYLSLCPEVLGAWEHINIDLSEMQVESLEAALGGQIPESLFRTEGSLTLLHISGLEASFLEEIMAGNSIWVPRLEEEWEQVRGAFPAGVVIWTDAYTATRMEQEAPTLWSQLQGKLKLSGGKPEGQARPEDTPFEILINAGKWEEALQAIQQAWTGEQAGAYSQSQLRYLTGNIFFDHHRWESAAGYYRDVIAEAAAEDGIWAAKSQRALGATYANKGEIEEGLAALDKAAEQFEELEAFEDMGRAFGSMAQIYQAIHDIVESIQHRLYAAEAYRVAELPAKAGDQLRQAAPLYAQKGKVPAAIELLEQAAQEYEQAADALEQARALQEIGLLHQRQMKWTEALNAFQQALPLAQQVEVNFLVESLEDSIRDMEGKTGGKKGLLGRLFG